MTTIPDVRTGDIDGFGRSLLKALQTATPQEMSEAVVRACEYLERPGLDPDRDYERINNATSLICKVTRILAARDAERQKLAKEVAVGLPELAPGEEPKPAFSDTHPRAARELGELITGDEGE